MVVSLLLLVVVLAVGAGVLTRTAVRRARPARQRPGRPHPRASLQDLFTHLMLFAGVVVGAVGTAGLLGRLVARQWAPSLVDGGPAVAARYGAFVVVGLPVAAVCGWAVRRRLRTDPATRQGPAWVGYVSLISLTALAVAMSGLHDGLLPLLAGPEPKDPGAVGRALVWSLVWLVHWRLDRRLTPGRLALPHLLAGSALGLAVTVVGAVGLAGNAADLAWNLRPDAFTDPQDQLRRAAVTLLVGAPVWALYWWRHARRAAQGPLRQAFLLLTGTVAGTVTAIVAAAWAAAEVLIWFAGDPVSTTAAAQFRNLPHLLAAALAGVAVREYHLRLLGAGATAGSGRAEAHRARDHGAALLGVLAGCTGGVLLVGALLAALTTAVTVAATTPVDTALVGLAVLLAGAPVGRAGFRGIRTALRADGAAERGTPTRRAYLLGLTGAGTLVAFGSLVATVYLLFQDLFAGTVGAGTLRSMRWALGLLLVATAVAALHARAARAEQALHPRPATPQRRLLLVGPADDDLADAVAAATGARVGLWPRTDGVEPAWTVDDVRSALAAVAGDDVLVVRAEHGLVAVPVAREPHLPATRHPAPAAVVGQLHRQP